MHRLITFAALSSIAVASMAQPSRQVVAGPNRTTSSQLASATKAGGAAATTGGGGGGAPVFVDATGKTVGRVLGSFGALTSYNNRPLLILLADDYEPVDGNDPAGGIRRASWGYSLRGFAGGNLWYVSSDCTGAPHLSPRVEGAGAAQVGYPVWDASDGQHYVYIADGAGPAAQIVPQSIYSAGRCFGLRDQPASAAQLVQAVVPASTFGTGSIFMK
jgi:hypothetical protein